MFYACRKKACDSWCKENGFYRSGEEAAWPLCVCCFMVLLESQMERRGLGNAELQTVPGPGDPSLG